jgi:hypothetical protein
MICTRRECALTAGTLFIGATRGRALRQSNAPNQRVLPSTGERSAAQERTPDLHYLVSLDGIARGGIAQSS